MSRNSFLFLVSVLALGLGSASHFALYEFSPSDFTVNIIDSFENTLNAFYLSHGMVAYRDFASNHFPGVYQLIAGFNALFGINDLKPSVELVPRAILVARFTTVGFQFAAFAFALSLLRVSPLVSLPLGAGLIHFANKTWLTGSPMTESFHFFLFMSWPILLYRAIYEKDPMVRLRSAFLLALPHPALSLWFGLTSAPTSILGSMFAILLASPVRRDIAAWMTKDRILIASAMTLLLAITISMALQADLEMLYFYNFPFNQNLHIDSTLSLKQTLFWPLEIKNDMSIVIKPFGYGILLTVAVVLQAQREHRPRQSTRGLMFFAFMFLGYLAVYWRDSLGIKTIASWGITVGLIFLLTKPAVDAISRSGSNFQKYPKALTSARYVIAMLCFAFGAYHFSQLYHRIYPLQNWVNRSDVLDRTGICRFGDSVLDCRCVRHTIWDPIFYLAWDVQQCPGWGVYMWLISLDDVTRAKLDPDLRDDKVAFVVHKGFTSSQFGFPIEKVNHLLASGACFELEEGGRDLICPGHD